MYATVYVAESLWSAAKRPSSSEPLVDSVRGLPVSFQNFKQVTVG